MTEQELIRWARGNHPDDPNLTESGTQKETDASLVYLWDVLLAEGEQG